MAKEEKNLAHAGGEPLPELEALKEWWKKHGDKLSYALIAVLVAIIGAQYHGKSKIRSYSESFAELDGARDPEAMEQIIEKNKSPAVTAVARLRLGQHYFSAGKYSLAKSAYEAFLKSHSKHPYADVAKVGLAFCAEAEGNVAAAADLFKAFVDANHDSFLEPIARIGLGRSLVLAGKKDEGKAVLDLFITERAGTRWAIYADDVLRNRNRLAVPKADVADIAALLNMSGDASDDTFSAAVGETSAAPAPEAEAAEAPAEEAAPAE